MKKKNLAFLHRFSLTMMVTKSNGDNGEEVPYCKTHVLFHYRSFVFVFNFNRTNEEAIIMNSNYIRVLYPPLDHPM